MTTIVLIFALEALWALYQRLRAARAYERAARTALNAYAKDLNVRPIGGETSEQLRARLHAQMEMKPNRSGLL